MIPRVDVLGVRVSAIDMSTALGVVDAWIASDAREYVCVSGVHGVMESQSDPELRAIHNSAGMITPDGMPLVWCSHYAGADWVERVYGPDLMLAVSEASVDRGWRHFYYGAAPGVADEMAARLSARFAGLSVVGTHSPPYRALDDHEIMETAEMINGTGANIVWVGLSTPKQERWMARLRPHLEAQVLFGVGAAFDMHAGRLRQAPGWMQRSGLEWLFRLGSEPRRLWRRYLSANPRFVWRIVRQRPRLVE